MGDEVYFNMCEHLCINKHIDLKVRSYTNHTTA